ncbi:MAG: HAMP domain-containing sensor histidine kinase [Candidatus Eremiobacterota bacterium]
MLRKILESLLPPTRAPAPRDDALAQCQRRERELAEELERRVEELTLLEDLARELAQCRDLKEGARTLLHLVHRFLACQTVALFWSEGDQWTCQACDGPHRDRAEAAPLLGVRDPMLERARTCREPVRRHGRDRPGQRLFPDEDEAVAVPVGRDGVLYAGSAPGQALDERRVQLLAVVSSQAASSLLQAAAASQEREVEARRLTQAHREATEWSRGLTTLLDNLPGLIAVPDETAFYASLCGLALQAAPDSEQAQLWWLRDSELELLCASPDAPAPEPDDLVLMLPGLRVGTALIFDDLSGTRFRQVSSHWTSLVAVPIPFQGEVSGVLVLTSRTPAVFSRQDGQLLGFLALHAGVALDRIRLHQEVVEAYARLQESQAKLIQSSKLAAVGQLAAGVAHEINTPLGSILLAVETVRDTDATSERSQKLLNRARESALRAQEIVGKMLYYSRDAREVRYDADLARVVSDTLDLVGKQLEMNGIETTCELPGCAVPVTCNPNEIQQVLINLLINARDALLEIPEGTRRVRVTCRQAGPGGVVEVCDNGPGIPESVLPRIFEPFYTTKPVGQGTGLGLSVSYQIVAHHHGRLSVESKPGETTFTLELPGSQSR